LWPLPGGNQAYVIALQLLLPHVPRTMEELQEVLAEAGLAWETNLQVGWRLHWLESAGLVGAVDGKYELIASGLDEQHEVRPEQSMDR